MKKAAMFTMMFAIALAYSGLTFAAAVPKADAPKPTTVPKAEGTPAAPAAKVHVRVGTYDSRAIAVAFAGSETFRKRTENAESEYEKAKKEENQKRVAELGAEAVAQAMRRQKQVFSTAPVDDILAHIKDKLPEIAQKAGVGPIVSKWDKEALAKYESAELVDVTIALVEALNPNEQQLKYAIEIQKYAPVSLEEVDNSKDWLWPLMLKVFLP